MADFHARADSGKYTVVLPEEGRPHMLRYGEPWVANPHPNNVELALAYRVQELAEAGRRLANHYEQHFKHLVERHPDALSGAWTPETDSALAQMRKALNV
jgi:hypothetical protein